MNFRHPQQRDDFIRHVDSLLAEEFVSDSGELLTGYPLILLQRRLRGEQLPPETGSIQSQIGRNWVWDVPSSRRDFARALKKCGFRTVSGRDRSRPTARGGPFLVVVREPAK